jgi:ribose transport system permease protein
MSAHAGTAASELETRDDFLHNLRFRFRPSYRLVWFALGVLLLACAATGPDAFHEASIRIASGLTGVLALAAAGQALVIIGGGIDLSVPAIMTLAAGMVVKLTQGHDSGMEIAVLEALLAGGVIGLLNGLIVSLLRISALIVTLAMTGIVTGFMLVWAGVSFSPTGKVPPSLIDLGDAHVGPVSTIGIVSLVLLAVLAWLLRHTRVGWTYVAVGTNKVAADIIGVRVRAYEIAGYAAAGVMYAVAGIVLACIIVNPDYTLGGPYQLSSIIAVALGGASLSGGPASLLCTAAACAFLALLDQYLAVKGFTAGVNQVANGVVLLVSVAVVSMASSGRLRLGDLTQAASRRLRRSRRPVQ